MFLFIDLDPCYWSLALPPGDRLGRNVVAQRVATGPTGAI
jgi:hypothetical protein